MSMTPCPYPNMQRCNINNSSHILGALQYLINISFGLSIVNSHHQPYRHLTIISRIRILNSFINSNYEILRDLY